MDQIIFIAQNKIYRHENTKSKAAGQPQTIKQNNYIPQNQSVMTRHECMI